MAFISRDFDRHTNNLKNFLRMQICRKLVENFVSSPCHNEDNPQRQKITMLVETHISLAKLYQLSKTMCWLHSVYQRTFSRLYHLACIWGARNKNLLLRDKNAMQFIISLLYERHTGYIAISDKPCYTCWTRFVGSPAATGWWSHF